MKELLNQFTRNIFNESQLTPVLPKNPIIICFQLEYELYFLEISASTCDYYQKSPGKTDVWIKGDYKFLQAILNGEERLRKLETKGLITITGKFKDILMAETLFYLVQKRLSA